jgi:ubiquinone/menaquinone biosynthesis C-methylase UbiE
MMQTPPVCNYEGSDYQTSFWEKGGRDYEDGCEAVALKRLLPAAGSRLLELGAGAGRNTSRYSGYAQVTLLDFSRTQLEQAKARLGTGERYRYIAADIYRLPFVEGLFDGATMIRTLHHMAEPALALAQVHRVLEPEATFILEFANKRNLKSILRYLLGRQKWSPYTREAVEYLPLNFDFHPAAIRDWMDGAGFILERALTVSHFRVSFLKKTLPARLLVAVDALLQPTGGLFQLTPSVFLRARALKTGVKAPCGAFFACPACATPLDDTPPVIHCPACEKQYPVIDDIYDFRLNPPAEVD